MRNENCDRKSSCDDYKHNHCDGCGGNKPTGDLISREALKEALSKRLWFVSSPECDAQEIKEVIDNAPTVEPDRPQGKWIWQTDFDGFTYWKCSNCNKKNEMQLFDFCPNCGAEMRKGGEYE